MSEANDDHLLHSAVTLSRNHQHQAAVHDEPRYYQAQRGRHAQTMYRKTGIYDCIATYAQDYVDIAVRLGTDRQFAAQIRGRILRHNQVPL